jgi:hypothetical protein
MTGVELVWALGFHLVLTGLPIAALALLVARLGVRKDALALTAALAGSAALALLGFWAYYADPVIGQAFSFLVIFGSAILSAWILWERRLEWARLLALATPLALWGLGTYFLVFLGYMHGGAETPLATAAVRFSYQLPSDNGIPFFFGEWFYANGHSGTVPVFPGEWLSSDRPPLQIGYMLLSRPLEWGSKEAHYQLQGVALQQLWIVGLWALLVAGRVGRLTRGLAMTVVAVSGVAIVNGFFVWPKLLPAALLLAAAALVLTPLWEEVRQRLWGAALVAALLGLAMMGHGASVFAAIPLAAVAAYRGLPSGKWIGVALGVGVALMAPWSAYQKWGDPPGDRLTKWMLAGVTEIDDRGVGESILDSYGEAGVGGTLHNKGQNFVVIAGGGPMVESLDRAVSAAADGDLAVMAQELRALQFFDLLPSLGLLLIAPIVIALRRRAGRERIEEWRLSLTLWASFAIGTVAWALLLFGGPDSRTVIHAGSLAIPLLGTVAAVVGLRAVAPRFAFYYCAFAAAATLALYVPSFDLPGYSLPAIVISALALGAYAVLAARAPELRPAADPTALDGRDLDLPALSGAVAGDHGRQR